jgi:hypothetical protein
MANGIYWNNYGMCQNTLWGGLKMGFVEDIKININRLEKECQEQPSIFAQYGYKTAALDMAVKKQKTKCKLIESNIIDQIKKQKDRKATVQEIDAEINLNLAYAEAKDKLIKLEYDLSVSETEVEAFRQRRVMLENEVKLWLGNYFSSVKMVAEKEIKEKRSSETEEKIRKKLNRKG